MASFGDQSRGQALGSQDLDRTTERGLGDKSISAKIEFEVWRSAFQRSHASWANAPAELRPMMLLSGPALVRAESWLLNFPDKLSVSERRFVKQSLAQNNTSENVAFGSGPETLSIVGGMWVVAFAVVVSMFGPFLPGLIKQGVISALPEEVREVINAEDRSRVDPGATKPHVPAQVTKPAPKATVEARDNAIDEQAVVIPVLNVPAREANLLSAAQLMQRAQVRLEQKDIRAALLLAAEAAHLTDRNGVNRTPSSELVSAASLVVQSLTQQVGAGPQPAISPASASVLFCDGGRTWIAAGADGFLQVAGQGYAKKLSAVPKRPSPLQGASVTSDCRLLAIPGEDHTLGLWSVETGQKIAELWGHTGPLVATAFRADGSMVVSASQDSSARVWDARTGRLMAVLEGHDREVISAAFSPDGQRVVTGSKDGTLRIWTMGQQVNSIKLVGHAGAITQGQFSPDGATVLSTSIDGFVALWGVATGELDRKLESEGTAILTAEFSPDGRRVVTLTQDGFVQVWDRDTGQVLTELQTADLSTRRVAFSPDGLRLLTITWHGDAVLWDGQTGKLIARLNSQQDRVESAAFAGGGAAALALLSQGAVVRWPVYGSSMEAVEAGQAKAGDCLTRDERRTLALSLDPPVWCGPELLP